MQNFTPIGATVAETSVTGQEKTATNYTMCPQKVLHQTHGDNFITS